MKTSLIGLTLLLASLSSQAAVTDNFTLTLNAQGVSPKVLTLPSDKKVALVVRNQSQEPVELEGNAFSSEVVVAPQGQTTVYVGPLKQGEYSFYNDYHRDETGTIQVVQP